MENTVSEIGFGKLLRSWRAERRLSQAELALTVQTPSRHVSFLETGRAKPSREMVARLATALQVPISERNLFYRSAGFADVYLNRPLDDPDMRLLHEAVNTMIHAHDPCPAFAFDGNWAIVNANTAGHQLISHGDANLDAEEEAELNILDLSFDPRRLRRLIENWDAFARQAIQRLHREAASKADLEDALDRIARYPDLPKDWWAIDVNYTVAPVFPINIKINDVTLALFTVISTIASPTNAFAQELRIETLLPSDEQSRETLHKLSW